jgi:predicted nucleic acid-binding protein
MPGDPERIYWDANVPLSYINGVSGRVHIIDELLRQARAGDIEVVTSILSKVEVAFAATEKADGQLDPAVEEAIDNFWRPGSPVKFVEFYELIADGARALVRQGIAQGWGALKPADAIHLATAQQLQVECFHTYDQRLLTWNGSAGFPIVEPETAQGLLDTSEGAEP